MAMNEQIKRAFRAEGVRTFFYSSQMVSRDLEIFEKILFMCALKFRAGSKRTPINLIEGFCTLLTNSIGILGHF
jgi:hypothetical protein